MLLVIKIICLSTGITTQGQHFSFKIPSWKEFYFSRMSPHPSLIFYIQENHDRER